MSDARAQVLAFIDELYGPTPPLTDEGDLFGRLGIQGADAGEFIEAFVARFDVDAATYRWYFHHGEEGWNIGGLFYTPVHKRYDRIPITVAVLTEAVRTRQWPVTYPDHSLPRRRWDILITRVFAAACLFGLVAWGWLSFSSRG